MEGLFGFPLLFDAAVKGTLVLLAATALVLVLRGGSAASRHLIWQLAVMALLALPLVKVVSPLRLPLLPELRSPIVNNESPSWPATGDRAATAPPAARQVETATVNPASAVSSAAASEKAAAPQTPWAVRLLTWLALAWLLVTAALLLRLLLGFVLVRWFALRGYPLYEDGWADLNGELSALIGLRRSVRLYASPHIATPMTWGIMHPVIMLPSAAEDWSLERRRVVMLHELAHVRRSDSLNHMFAQIACAVYWFHPLVWKAAARMRAEAERACDDLVLRAGTKASVYAEHLLELIRTLGGMRTPVVALPMAQRSTFEGRLLAILEPHLDRTTPRRVSIAAMIVVVGLIVLPLAGLTTASAIVTDPDTPSQTARKREPLKKKESHKSAALPASTSEAPHAGVGVAAEPPRSSALDNVTQDIAQLAQGTSEAVIKKFERRFGSDAGSGSGSGQGAGSGSGWGSGGQQKNAHLAVVPLMRALADSDVEVRLIAAQSLGELEDSVAVAALSNALRNDSDARVRKMAAWALGQIECEKGVPALAHAIRSDRDVEVRRTAVWALGQIEDASAVPVLAGAVDDGDAEVRSLSVWALGQIEDASAVPALVNVLRNDKNVDARRQAAWALGEIEDANAVPALAAALRDTDAGVREQAVWALGEIESAQAVAPLSALTKDPSSGTRKQVAWALGQIESAAAVPALTAMLRDDEVAEVREMAAWALGQIESADAVPALGAALKDRSAGVRHQAAWALGQIEPQTAPQALLDALKDSDKQVRVTAAWALAQIEDPNSASALRATLRDADPDVRNAVLQALVSLGDQMGYDALAEMLKDTDPEVRRAAAAALGRKGSGWHDPKPQPRPQPQPKPQPRPLQ